MCQKGLFQLICGSLWPVQKVEQRLSMSRGNVSGKRGQCSISSEDAALLQVFLKSATLVHCEHSPIGKTTYCHVRKC